MQRRLSGSLRVVLIGLLLLLALAACSRVSLVYRNLDTLIPWSVDDYLNMTRSQQQALRVQVREHLQWHCSTQLPEYLAWIDSVKSEPVTPVTVRQRVEEAKEAGRVVGREVTPALAELMRDLSPRQVEQIAETFAEKQQKRAREHLKPDLEQQIARRAERMRERAADWFGSVSPAQRQRIDAWSGELGDLNQRWLDNQARWEAAMIDVLKQRRADDFPERLSHLVLERKAYWTDAYRETQARNEQAGIELAADLYALADERQRRHLVQRLEKIRKDLAGLKCLGERA